LPNKRIPRSSPRHPAGGGNAHHVINLVAALHPPVLERSRLVGAAVHSVGRLDVGRPLPIFTQLLLPAIGGYRSLPSVAYLFTEATAHVPPVIAGLWYVKAPAYNSFEVL